MDSICISIAEETYSEVINALKDINFAEIRLDISHISNDEIKQLFKLNKKFVATCREGFYSDKERLTRLKLAIEHGTAYVDIETEAPKEYREELLKHAKKHNIKVIISYHNFKDTPSTQELTNITDICRKQGADIIKLVTKANSVEDSSRVLALYNKHKNILAFSMGKLGRITRVASIYLGAEFTYAAQSEEKAVAGGQLTKEQMEIIGNII